MSADTPKATTSPTPPFFVSRPVGWRALAPREIEAMLGGSRLIYLTTSELRGQTQVGGMLDDADMSLGRSSSGPDANSERTGA